MKRRVYIDTSVIGGCFDEEFKIWSDQLMFEFISGDKIMVLSDTTLRELDKKYNGVNLKNGYPVIEIRTPREIIKPEENEN